MFLYTGRSYKSTTTETNGFKLNNWPSQQVYSRSRNLHPVVPCGSSPWAMSVIGESQKITCRLHFQQHFRTLLSTFARNSDMSFILVVLCVSFIAVTFHVSLFHFVFIVFYHCVFTYWSIDGCTDLFSSTATRVFNKLTYLLPPVCLVRCVGKYYLVLLKFSLMDSSRLLRLLFSVHRPITWVWVCGRILSAHLLQVIGVSYSYVRVGRCWLWCVTVSVCTSIQMRTHSCQSI